MAETFGKTDIGGTRLGRNQAYIQGIKYPSGSAGSLASMSVYIEGKYADTKVKCAIYDSSLNLVANGTTEEKTIQADYLGWLTFNFPVSPVVAATTNYWLCVRFDTYLYMYYAAGGTDQHLTKNLPYGDWPATLTPEDYNDRAYSIFATYYEEEEAKKTLVQAALISAAPLILLPTLHEIAKFTGGRV